MERSGEVASLEVVRSRLRGRFGAGVEDEHYRWWALSCTSLGMLLAATNSGTLIIALPDLERSLHTSLLVLVWVILAYLIAATVLVLMAGRLSDLFGRKRAYVGGFLLFAFASLGAGFAPNGTVLILWRVLQGIGSAFLFANAAALVTDAFPREQLGLAMGANTMIAAVGLVLGPVLGGALVAISWHWVFWFNVPLALAGAAWGALILRELAKPDSERGYDVLGTTTFVIGLTGLVLGVSRGGLSGWNDPIVVGGLIAAAVLLPLWIVIEKRSRAPMLDLKIFNNRLFAAASAAAFINGLARFALMFLFVFYFQGAQGSSPIEAGVELMPLAVGMLIASPLAGVYADRHGSRGLAAIGMLLSALGLAGMTTLAVHTPYWQSAVWLFLVGAGSGMFNSPNTAAMMGVVPAKRRGVAAGARTLLQNTGAVLSIAFVLAVVTSSIPKATLFAVFSGLATGLSAAKLDPFIANMHTALWALSAVSLLGAGVCLLRPSHAAETAAAQGAPGTRVPSPAPAPAAPAAGSGTAAATHVAAGEPVPSPAPVSMSTGGR
jgi:EmrB/QacA subfamily drug resistance transporter